MLCSLFSFFLIYSPYFLLVDFYSNVLTFTNLFFYNISTVINLTQFVSHSDVVFFFNSKSSFGILCVLSSSLPFVIRSSSTVLNTQRSRMTDLLMPIFSMTFVGFFPMNCIFPGYSSYFLLLCLQGQLDVCHSEFHFNGCWSFLCVSY